MRNDFFGDTSSILDSTLKDLANSSSANCNRICSVTGGHVSLCACSFDTCALDPMIILGFDFVFLSCITFLLPAPLHSKTAQVNGFRRAYGCRTYRFLALLNASAPQVREIKIHRARMAIMVGYSSASDILRKMLRKISMKHGSKPEIKITSSTSLE